MKPFVGNLICATRTEEPVQLFFADGVMHEVSLHTSWQGIISRPYAWIDMPEPDADRARLALHAHLLREGRRLLVERQRSKNGVARGTAENAA
jgi:hypothetical protein